MDNSEQTPLEASTPEGQIQPELAIPPTPPKRRPSKKIIALIFVCLVIMLAAGLALG